MVPLQTFIHRFLHTLEQHHIQVQIARPFLKQTNKQTKSKVAGVACLWIESFGFSCFSHLNASVKSWVHSIVGATCTVMYMYPKRLSTELCTLDCDQMF